MIDVMEETDVSGFCWVGSNVFEKGFDYLFVIVPGCVD